MIKGKSILAVVSTSGCRSLAQRYLRTLSGKPLFRWTVDAAKSSRLVDNVVLSSNDSALIAQAQALNVPTFEMEQGEGRPQERFGDSSLCILTVLSDFDYFVLLDAGCPLRLQSDIDGAIEVSARNDGTPVVTVSEMRVSRDALVVLDGNRKMTKPAALNTSSWNSASRMYSINKCISVASSQYLRQHGSFLTEDTHAYIMPAERSIIVESKGDLAMAEGLMRLTGTGEIVIPNYDVNQIRPVR
ncbi:MAG: 2-C-methyl-D-erythritol 4-phosphate cytidylyltransferase [Candidatus Obscuribacterales bacterium]|nr:2-C-methyl-D-erythritol 4-phosphate cytidylyltransferase [Candidatus Obscuribacterales bacterium]